MRFPKRTKAQEQGEIGITIVSDIVSQRLGMIFRRVPQEHDYGIDGFIDYVVEGRVTGGTVAVQIKCGESYLRDETADGYWYEDTFEHLNYYLNHPAPVFVFLVDPQTRKVYWNDISVEKLLGKGKKWRTLIPKDNVLEENFSSRVQELLGLEDFSGEIHDSLRAHEALVKLMSRSNMTMLGIGREAIETKNTRAIASYFEALRSDKTRAKNSQGKVGFYVSGYDDDSRELYEIPEVVEYFKILEPQVKYWFYFLSTDHSVDSLKVLLFCLCDPEKGEENGMLYPNLDLQKSFFERNFFWLNEMTNFLGEPISENKRISLDVFKYLGIPEDVLEKL
jgi:hypothetical protein